MSSDETRPPDESQPPDDSQPPDAGPPDAADAAADSPEDVGQPDESGQPDAAAPREDPAPIRLGALSGQGDRRGEEQAPRRRADDIERRDPSTTSPIVRITTDPGRRISTFGNEPDVFESEGGAESEPEPHAPVPEEFERPGGKLSRLDGHLVMYHEPRSLHAEQYRSCRTNLVALNRGGAPWALVVTSSKAGEGKSVTAANLAVCLAELPGARVCLVDCDFRAPTQGTVFGRQPGKGLTELIVDNARWSEVVRNTVIEDLDIIPAGREPESTAELLGSDRFTDLVHELKRRYTWIILDTPPVHPYTDACVLSSVVNGALIVVRLQETPRELVNRAIDSITTAGGRVLGTFLTGLQPDRDEAERQQYYRVDGLIEGTPEEADKRREQLKRERHLEKQERAWLRKQRKAERARDLDDEGAV